MSVEEISMSPVELLQWQWSGYQRVHTTRGNLLLHIVAVPLFLSGNLLLIAGAISALMPYSGIGAAAMLVAMAAQGRGHKLEPLPPEPFTGIGNALSRIFLEQWVTFPRFVLSGAWVKAFRKAV
jgi:hypothetical protein